ncbi:MAG: SMC-Scp complex subunit ScpB [Nitrosomonas sp.]
MSAPSHPPDPLTTTSSPLSPDTIKQILEAALLTAQEPLPISELRKLFDQQFNAAMLSTLLEDIRRDWNEKSVELVKVASGWRFQTKPEIQPYLDRLTPQRPPRYSRAVMETLAIIAYRQPVTRGDIEEIRGVSVSASVLKTLTARGWIESVGQRNVPGKPALFATTAHFLNDLNLNSLEELPPLEEMKSLIGQDDQNQVLPLEQSHLATVETQSRN